MSASNIEPVGEPVEPQDLANASLLGRLIKLEVCSVDTTTSMSGAGGLSGEMTRIRGTLVGSENATLSVVVKSTKVERLAQAAELGLAREAYFYNGFAARIHQIAGDILPHVYFAYGDFASGHKVIVLEDIDAIQLGYFFGNGSPHNWGKDLAALTSSELDPAFNAETASRQAFLAYAKLHSTFWNDRELTQHAYLRGSDWYQARGKESFQASQDHAAKSWAQTKIQIAAGTNKVNWAPQLVAAFDASFERVSWTSFQARIQSTPFTLVHGDGHPANMLWQPKKQRLVLLDFEVVGLGSGPQDLSQFVISHMAPAVRRDCEHRLVREYYDALTLDSQKFDWDTCWTEYKMGGCERWVWLLAVMSTMCPAPMMQYWHDQLLHFMNDHGISAENIGMPRV